MVSTVRDGTANLLRTNELWTGLAALFICGFLLKAMCRGVCNLLFHPLSKLPGPWMAALSNLPFCYWNHSGRMPYQILALHEKYGPVVRVAPNEVSFNSPQSWNDIYGFRKDHQTFIKTEFYDLGSFANRGVHSIVSERDVNNHAQMRRHVSHAFSDHSLLEQESLISETVDKFVKVAGKRGSGSSGFDLAKAFDMMTFDIIGDLAFGETFKAIESDKPHPWISITLGAMTQGAFADTFKRFPLGADIFMTLMPGKIAKLNNECKQNEDFSIELVKKRINRHDTARKDFMTRILEQRDPEKVSDLQLAAHASDFVLAGSETTATALSCIMYYLFKNPTIMAKLKQEVRTTFKHYSEITSISTAPLQYLKAVILEGIRICPPVPMALPRLVPEGGDTVDGHFLPAGTVVTTNPLAASLSSRNFSNPWTFRPERWLGSEDNKQDILAGTQPFSLGPRGCIGRNLAWLELRTVLVKLLWTYELTLLDQTVDWHRDLRMQTLWNKPALLTRVEARKGF